MKKSNKLFMGLAVILLVGAGSCEIGLGPAVDVNAPTVSINYPPEGRTIMDSFVLAGECDDDSSIDTIFIDLENASENAAVKHFSYTVKPEEGGKTWKANINNNVGGKYELPDGKWTASVYVKDTVGRTSGTVSRSFDIDNTAPSLLISNLSSVGNDTPITFGAIIQIKGEITEEHETSNLRFNYQKVNNSGNLVGDEQFIDRGAVTDISSDTPFVIARNYTDEEINNDAELQELKNNYDLIHDTEMASSKLSNGDQKVYCTFELYDNARSYTNPDDLNDAGAGEGNKSIVYNVKSHEEPVSISETKKVTTDSSCFILNPDNKPRYTISTYKYKKGDATSFQKLAVGTQISLAITAGKDGALVKPQSVEVKLREITRDGEDVPNTDVTILSKGSWTGTDDDVKIQKGIDIIKAFELTQDHFYKIIVEAEDRNGVKAVSSLEDEEFFGFHFDSSSLPPEVIATYLFKGSDRVEAEEKKLENDISISGVDLKNHIYIPITIETNSIQLYSTDTTEFGELVKIKDKSIRTGDGSIFSNSKLKCIYPEHKTFKQSHATEASSSNFTMKDGTIKFELEIYYEGDIPEDKYTIDFIVEATRDGDNPKTAEKSISFTVDSKLPEVNNTKVLPVVIENSSETINGKVTFTASVSDNYELDDTAYKVYGGDTKTEITKYTRDFATNSKDKKPSDITIENIDTYADLAGYNYLKIYVQAKDSVGNIYNKDWSEAAITYEIDQTKDKPVITANNFTQITDENDENITVFDKNNNKLSFVITDDDGIGSITKKIDDGDEEDVPVIDSSNNKLLIENGKPFDIPVTGLDAGVHTIEIKVVDSKNETGTYATNTYTTKFAIDNEMPVIKETKINSEAKYILQKADIDKGTFDLTIETSDDWGVKNNGVTFSLVGTQNEPEPINGNKVTITLPKESGEVKDGVYTYELAVEDKAGKTSSINRVLCVDKIAPEFKDKEGNESTPKVTTKKADNNNIAYTHYNTNSIQIEGYATDENGIKEVRYSLDGTNYSDTLNISVVEDTEGKTVKYSGYISGLKEGENNVSIKIIDNADNADEKIGACSVLIDTVAPTELTLTSEAGDKFSNGTAKYDIAGTVKDETSGIYKVQLVLKSESGDDDVKDCVFTDGEDNKKIWTFDDYPAIKGILVLRVTDNAGNKEEKNLFKIETDSEKPSAEIKNVVYKASENSLPKDTTENNQYNDANGTIVVSGTAKDNKQLKSVSLKYKLSNASAWTTYKTISETDVPAPDLNNWSFEIDTTDTTKFTDGEKYDVLVTVEDRAGNKSEETTIIKIVINQDSDRPIIKITNFALNSMTKVDGNRVKLVNQKRINFTVMDDDDVAEITVKVIDENTGSEDFNDKVTNGYIETLDGRKNIIFTIKDKENNIFTTQTYSNDETLLKTPYILGNEASATKFGTKGTDYKDTVLYVAVDNEGPKLKTMTFATSCDDGTKYATPTTAISDQVVGGSYNKLKINLKLQDANGIQSVVLKIKDGDEVTSEKTGTPVWNGDEAAWEFKDINIDTTKPSIDYEFTFTDYLDNKTTEPFTIDIDNEAPELFVTSHIENEMLGSNFILKGKISGYDKATTVKYIIDATAEYEKDATVWNDAEELKDADAGFANWYMYIDGDVNNTDGYTHTQGYKKFFVNNYSSEAEIVGTIIVKKGEQEKYTDVQPLYFHFLVTDGAGNQSVKDFKLRFDPQGDIPTVTVKYPSEGKTVTGKVRTQGIATVNVNNKIAGIYMQIDPNYSGSGTPDFSGWKGNGADSTVKATNGTTLLNTIYTSGSENPIEYIYSRCEITKTEADADKLYGIYVGNKENWSLVINRNKEFATNGTNKIAIRMYAVDNMGNVNDITDEDYTSFEIDSNAPSIGSTVPFAVWQYKWKATDGTIVYTNTPEPTTSKKAYSDSGCRNGEKAIASVGTNFASITVEGKSYSKDFATMPYSKNMWLKGEWWLTGSVEDESGIKTIKITSDTVEFTILGENSTEISSASYISKKYSCTKSGNHDYLVSFRVGSASGSSAGELSYKIYVEENESSNVKSSEDTFDVNYDNKAPDVTKMKLANNGTITNSYGFYQLGTTASELGVQSGFARAVVYFTRESSKVIYDPYIRSKQTGNAISYENLTQEEGIYWYSTKVTAISGRTVTIQNDSANIHRGSLVKFGGAYFTVTAKNGKSITLDFEPDKVLNNADIKFAYGIVIDQESEADGSEFVWENEGYGYYDLDDNDDFMVEKAITNNGETEWAGNINTNNIPDGKIKVHYVVYDNAGNYKEGTAVEGKVANNALRITGVKAWCDFNGNGTPDEDAGEVESYYNNSVTVKVGGEMVNRAGSFTTDLTTGKLMTVRDVTYIYPEFIGGNGTIQESHTYRNRTETDYENFCSGNEGNDYSGIDDEKDEAGYYRADEQGAQMPYYQGYSDYPSVSDSGQHFKLSVDDLGPDTEEGTFIFNFKDSTDKTPNEAKITLKLGIACSDTTPVKVKIGKFGYDSSWKPTQASKKYTENEEKIPYSHVYEMDLTKGHVELEEDWTKVKSSENKNGSTVNTYFTSYDATKAELDADPKVSGYVTMRGVVSDNYRIQSISIKDIKDSSYTTVANFNSGKMAVSGTYAYNTTTKLGFEIEKEENTQNGHTVYWAYHFDSSTVNTNKVQTDVTFGLRAQDTKGNDPQTVTYRMDVVPYITKVVTSLDKHNNNNPSVYNRTALGHYPIYATTKGFNSNSKVSASNETVTIKGFNMDEAKYTVTNNSTSETYDISVERKNGNTTVETLTTLNNVNYDGAEYNKVPNTLNNNILNDDVFFDIWDINTKAATGPNGDVGDLVMKINPKNGVLGFAFSNGGERFCMPGTASSYKKSNRSYDKMKYNALTYDKLGNAYAITVGGDIASGNVADSMSLMSSKWNASVVGDNQDSNKSDNYHIKIDSIGLSKNNSYQKKKDRFQSQSLATFVDDNDNTFLYYAYYDALLNQVRFKEGIVPDSKANFGNFIDAGGVSVAEDNAGASSCHIIANSNGTNTLGTAGQYVSISTTKNNRVVLVWYDGTELKYTYTTSSLESNDNITKGTVGSFATSRWATATKIMDAGAYCQVTVDSQNHVHIAAYDEDSRLYYAYIPTYTEPSTKYTCVVDAYNDVGQNLTIDVAKSGNYQIPYIGYWDYTLDVPRYAYLVKPENFQGTSASTAEHNGYNEKATTSNPVGYTGVWDCSIVPTPSTVLNERMNVGVWKIFNDTTNGISENCKGNLSDSKGYKDNKWSNLYTSSTTGNSGNCYGNGTSNGVMAYTISADSTTYVETAQKR